MKKSLFIIFLLIALHCHGIRVGSLEYNIYDYDRYGIGMAEVSAVNTAISGDITIPGGISTNGVQFNVTRIAKNGFEECRSLTSITLPPTITSIENRAFYNCRSLDKISFDMNHE
ncbi:MAG: leucine-rich repeat domain-containing protein, partial [Muribaculaceae bacterium]|nr:leucine-rich repeat domain-containing protein [Muribaculaceae bacterium]